jgi:hypothetical protein
MNKLKSLEELFDGRHFDQEIIIVCVCSLVPVSGGYERTRVSNPRRMKLVGQVVPRRGRFRGSTVIRKSASAGKFSAFM